MQQATDPSLKLDASDRARLWSKVTERIEAYQDRAAQLPVAPGEVRAEIMAALAPYDFAAPRDPVAVTDATCDWLERYLLHTTHPAYFGVFNPAASTMGAAADALVAAYNPQLASSASGILPIAVEDHLLRFFGARFGFPEADVRGSFLSGGTTANFTAVLCALNDKLPDFGTEGVGGRKPVLYTSKETHHSVLRAARLCGIGTSAVVELPVDEALKLDLDALRSRIQADRAAGKLPVMVTATLGSTSAGTFDDVGAIADVAEQEDLWLHCDAAWGGAAVLLPEYAQLFNGTERADSITLDAHKWLSVPMGAGMFITRHPHIQEATFRVDASPYMPAHTYDSPTTEPYKQSIEWSRRFGGLKLFMTLAVHGIPGYQAVLRHQIEMGAYLRERLTATGWQVVNRTQLPVVCFIDPTRPTLDTERFTKLVGETGRTWITPTKLQHTGQPVLRAGIPNFLTQREHVDVLVDVLDGVRRSL